MRTGHWRVDKVERRELERHRFRYWGWEVEAGGTEKLVLEMVDRLKLEGLGCRRWRSGGAGRCMTALERLD